MYDRLDYIVNAIVKIIYKHGLNLCLSQPLKYSTNSLPIIKMGFHFYSLQNNTKKYVGINVILIYLYT